MKSYCGGPGGVTQPTAIVLMGMRKGASIKYVRSEGGRGGLKKLLISAYDSTDRLREMRTMGREGVKNPENFA